MIELTNQQLRELLEKSRFYDATDGYLGILLHFSDPNAVLDRREEALEAADGTAIVIGYDAMNQVARIELH